MKRLIGIFAMLLWSAAVAHTQTAVLPVYACTLPGTQAKVSGLASTNYQMGVIPSCTVTVYLTGTGTIATTSPQSPFTANTNGSIQPIYAAINQAYDVVLSGGIPPNTYPSPVTLTDVTPGGAGNGCLTGNAIAKGCTGATTAAGAAANIVNGQNIAPTTVRATGQVSSSSGPLISGTSVYPTGQGIWRRIGVTNWTNTSAESTVWQEGSCRILTFLDVCFKRIYSRGAGVFYEESQDGINWTDPGVNTTVTQRPTRVIKISSTYYMYAENNGTNSIDEFTSTDGEHYTLANASVITPAMIPSGWPGVKTELDNSSALLVGSTLYLAVDNNFNSGLWSSTDYHTFTPVAFIIANCSVRSPFYEVGSQWYTWVHCTDNQVHRYTAASLTQTPWTDALNGSPDLSIQTLDEGAGQAVGQNQVADPFVLQVTTPTGLKTFMYYTATQGLTVNTPQEPWYEVLKLAIADMPISSVVQTNGGDDTSQLDIQSNLPTRFDYANSAINFKDFPVENLLNINFSGNPVLTFSQEIYVTGNDSTPGAFEFNVQSDQARFFLNGHNGAGSLDFENQGTMEWVAGTYLPGLGDNTWGLADAANSNHIPFSVAQGAPTNSLAADSSGNVTIAAGTNVVYVCDTDGATAKAGTLTITVADCGTSHDSGLRLK